MITTTATTPSALADRLEALAKKTAPGDLNAIFTDLPYGELPESWVIEHELYGIATMDGPKDIREPWAALIVELHNALPTILAALRAPEATGWRAGVEAAARACDEVGRDWKADGQQEKRFAAEYLASWIRDTVRARPLPTPPTIKDKP